MKCIQYIKSDLFRYCGKVDFSSFLRNFLRNPSFKYTFWFRLCSHEFALVRFVARVFHKKLSARYHIQIPVSTKIGFGLYIGHHMCVVINSTAIIGNNVNLSQFTTIGANDGVAAVVKDNVYIGPNVCIVEDVVVGENATIGAGSVVTKDIPDNSTAAGVPAKVLNFQDPGRYIKNRWLAS